MIEVQKLNLWKDSHHLLKDVSFSLQDGKTLGIIGVSGSGKSTLGKALIRLFDSSFKLEAQRLQIDSFDVLNLKQQKDFQKLRSKVGFVFQDVYGSFYPLSDVGEVFDLILKTHTALSSKERKQRAFGLFERLGLKHLDLLWHSYIYQLSGGIARRVQLALALACGAKYLICDEITSSLDVENEKKIIDYLKGLKEELNFVLITHNPLLLQELCDEVLVIQEGSVLELCCKEDFFLNPCSLYAKELLKKWRDNA